MGPTLGIPRIARFLTSTSVLLAASVASLVSCVSVPDPLYERKADEIGDVRVRFYGKNLQAAADSLVAGESYLLQPQYLLKGSSEYAESGLDRAHLAATVRQPALSSALQTSTDYAWVYFADEASLAAYQKMLRDMGTSVPSTGTIPSLVLRVPHDAFVKSDVIGLDFNFVSKSGFRYAWSQEFKIGRPSSIVLDYNGTEGKNGSNIDVNIAGYRVGEGSGGSSGRNYVLAVRKNSEKTADVYLFSENMQVVINAKGGPGVKGSHGSDAVLPMGTVGPYDPPSLLGRPGTSGGSGGAGGVVRIFKSEAFRRIGSAIIVNVEGGAGGEGGRGGVNYQKAVGNAGNRTYYYYSMAGNQPSGFPGQNGQPGRVEYLDAGGADLFALVDSAKHPWFDVNRVRFD